MKRLLTIFAILTSLVISSCSKYDDSEIRQKIDALEERVASIETLLKASANKLTIVSIEETENGTIITFSDNSKVTINNATEGISPIVDVEVDGDLVYITLDDGTILTFKNDEITENHKIYYTTIVGGKLDWNAYDPNTYVHTYENGQGILIFDKPVIYMQGLYNSKTLRTLVIPESVVEVGSFFRCIELKEIYCKAVIPPTAPPRKEDSQYGYYYFLDRDDPYGPNSKPIGCTIYVPMESVDAYKKAEHWSRYASYIKGYDFE